MAMGKICAFLLLFLSLSWAEEAALHVASKANITEDIWAELNDLKDMVIEQGLMLNNTNDRVQKLEGDKAAVDSRLSAAESEINNLKMQMTETPKVAFSLGLTDVGHVGPFTADITLKFSKVFTNHGQGYNVNTGIFTAPMRGAYFFRFTAVSYFTYHWTGVLFYHNNKRVSYISDRNDDVGFISVSNALVLNLEKGDVVYLVLRSGDTIFDNVDNRTVFSGFMLFPL